MFEYILIAACNDSDEQAHALAGHAGRLSAKIISFPHTVEGLKCRGRLAPQENFLRILRDTCRRHPGRGKATDPALAGSCAARRSGPKPIRSFPLVLGERSSRRARRDGIPPSPTAAAQRLTEPERTSPAAKTRDAGFERRRLAFRFASAAYRPPRSRVRNGSPSVAKNFGRQPLVHGFARSWKRLPSLDDAFSSSRYFQFDFLQHLGDRFIFRISVR